MEPRTGVHNLVHILVLCVHMAVDVDNSDLAVYTLRNSTRAWVANRVISTHDHWKSTLGQNVGHSFRDLVMGFGNVSRAKDISRVTHLE
jgi:hypothetical protein